MNKIKILSHRGIVRGGTTQNDAMAFSLAAKRGFGLETDLRDFDGNVVIAHDPPKAKSQPLLLSTFLKTWRETSEPGAVLALNIKADGLAKLVVDEMKGTDEKSFFFFDMSVPDSLWFLRMGLPVFGRVSEYEQTPPTDMGLRGIWLDCFKGEWFSTEDIKNLMNTFGSVALVSPDLHKRPHAALWASLKDSRLLEDSRLMICTDYPDDLKEMVNESR